jgi:desulfoferrodoxin (superoxide reductase-like protein)
MHYCVNPLAQAVTRRLVLVGLGLAGLGRLPAAAQGADREHRVKLDLPILSEEPTAVPLAVSLDHPMEPGHFIRWIEVTADNDPVPAKGRFVFTPANGRAWVAYQMRSGAGGTVTATAECSRHGRFSASQALRVVEGGCTTGPARGARERGGNPVVRLARTPRAGEIVEVRARVDHASHTGLGMRDGKVVREQPEYFVRHMAVFLDDEQVCEFRMTSAVSPNPLVRFSLRVARSGTLRVVFTNSEGQRWEAVQPLRV